MNLYIPILITAGFVISSFTMAAPPADDLLAGPSIEAEEVTSQDMTARVLKEQGKSKKVGSRQQSQMWRTALKVIDLTKDQEMEIHKIMEEFQKLNQIFRATHGKEIRSIRAEHDKKRDVLTTILIGAPKDQAVISEASQKRMLELMELSPDVTSYQERAWILLTSEQQTSFQVKYQELIVEDQKQHDERRNKDRPSMDEMPDREFAPKDSQFGDKEAGARGDRDTRGDRGDRDTRGDRGDIIGRRSDSVNDDSLRRIKFLQRLQRLQEQD